ncbi:hypothetical protein BJ878DRAFT_169790 [Calycina marina]|uniref:Uncharacterized protein n=1 Tax=Calycina marina TaxID=1763456 RepID=A0A9P7YZW2_9HELO|nr:hypothetical protein BJ878DRAFT_169790 [Calycina marina]
MFYLACGTAVAAELGAALLKVGGTFVIKTAVDYCAIKLSSNIFSLSIYCPGSIQTDPTTYRACKLKTRLQTNSTTNLYLLGASRNSHYKPSNNVWSKHTAVLAKQLIEPQFLNLVLYTCNDGTFEISKTLEALLEYTQRALFDQQTKSCICKPTLKLNITSVVFYRIKKSCDIGHPMKHTRGKDISQGGRSQQ